MEFGKLCCHAFFYFSEDFSSCKLVVSRLRQFEVRMQNEPVLE